MQPKKPELNAVLRSRLREMRLLLEVHYYTRDELMAYFNTNDRSVRDMVEIIKEYYPVISASDGRGYKIADLSNPDDVAMLTRTYYERKSMATKILNGVKIIEKQFKERGITL